MTVYFPAKAIVQSPEGGVLWIGSKGDSESAEFMQSNNIKYIVNCTRDIGFSFSGTIPGYRVPVHDAYFENRVMHKYLPIVVRQINEVLKSGGSVLVHCYAGMQRSATVVAAYLMYVFNMTKARAISYIQSRKSETFQPKPTFDKALDAWERRKAQNRVMSISPQPGTPGTSSPMS